MGDNAEKTLVDVDARLFNMVVAVGARKAGFSEADAFSTADACKQRRFVDEMLASSLVKELKEVGLYWVLRLLYCVDRHI